MLPLVSIAIITYNQAGLVAATLESALQQAYAPLEIVVADDGSTDGTLDVLRECEARHGARVRVVAGQNIGITANSNRVLRACRGELIAFQGGDDLLLPGKVAAQVRWFQADRSRVLCGHDVEHFTSEPGGKIVLQSELTRLRTGVGPGDFIAYGSIFAGTSVMVRRSAAPSFGFDERLPTISDGKFWIDCLLGGGRYGYVPGVLARYRRDFATSVTRSNRTGALLTEEFRVLDLVEEQHPELAAFCRRGRARLHRREGIAAVMQGRVDQGRQELLRSLRLEPMASVKTPLWLSLAYAPPDARQKLGAIFQRVSSLRSRILHREHHRKA